MTMDFSGSAGAASSFDTIPHGQLAFCVLTIRGLKNSGSGGQYIDAELTVDQGQPYAGRKFWEMIGNPFHQGNSEKYRQMGQIAITRICEAGRGAGPNNPAGYKLNDFAELSGLRVPVKIKIEEGEDGHDDKNRVAEWLTPNPASQSGFKHYEKLLRGEYAPGGAATPAPAASGFGATGNGAPAATGAFGSPAAASPAPAGSGFGQPSGGQPGGQSGFSPPGENGATTATDQSSATGAAASPSDPGATPGWLQQAGAQAQG